MKRLLLLATLVTVFATTTLAWEFAGTSRIRFQFHRSYLDLTILSPAGTVLGKQSWKTTSYDAPEGDGLMVRVSVPNMADDSYILLFEPTAEGQLLQARLIYVRASSFGPKLSELGTYYFHRSP